jgi:DHA2 family methylenomycin A resistance protein-like MFS transporter
VLSAVTVICIEGGRVGWGNPVIVSVTAAIPVLLACFLYVERVSHAPVLPLSMFRSTGTSIANAITVIMSLVLLGTIFILTQYFQVVENHSPLTAGVEMIPLFVPLVVGSSLSGRLTARKDAAFTSASGLLVGVVGMLLLARVSQDSGYVTTLLLPLVCIGSGMGLLTPAVVATAMREAPREHTGIASGVNNTARQAGGAIGAAVFGSLVGTPVMAQSFLHGLRLAAVTGAVLWAIGFALAVTLRKLGRDPS